MERKFNDQEQARRAKLQKLIETKQVNIALSDMLMCFFEENLKSYTFKSTKDYLKAFMDVLD